MHTHINTHTPSIVGVSSKVNLSRDAISLVLEISKYRWSNHSGSLRLWQNPRRYDENGIRLLVLNMGFPGGSEGKASAYNAGDLGLIPGLGRSPGEGNGNPLQFSCLKKPMDWEAW